MDTIETVVLIVHTFIAVLIIALVLLQRGKGADAGAAFGSGASGTVFGSRGSSSFFSRATAILATTFFVTSLALAYMTSQDADAPDSLLERAPAAQQPVDEQPADEQPAEESPAGTAEEPPVLPDLPAAEDAPAEDEAALPELEPAPSDEDDEPPGPQP